MTPATAERVEARFAPGERVRVLEAAPLGHVRTPWYIRGHRGVIERLCGAFPNPEELAYARPGTPRQPLYRVRFVQKDIWPGYAGHAGDVIEVEIFQHWLIRDEKGAQDAPLRPPWELR